MGELSPDTIGLWVSRDASNPAFRPLLDVTTDVLGRKLGGKSPEQCADLAERLLGRIGEALDRMALELREEGVEPSFEVSIDASTLYFRALETSAGKMLEKLFVMTYSEFEGFCAELLRRIGGDSRVVGKPADGGVDFVARNICLSGPGGPSPIGARALVLGQAKRWAKDSLVSETDVRAFVGGAIRRSWDSADLLTFRGPVLAPVALAFWTTSDFQPSAKKYAKAVGLWYLNGIGLAQLALRLGVPV